MSDIYVKNSSFAAESPLSSKYSERLDLEAITRQWVRKLMLKNLARRGLLAQGCLILLVYLD